MSKIDRKALSERGTDSAWIYHPFFARTRFYLGSRRVTGNEFESTLRNSDTEVDAQISGAWKKFNTSRYISWAGGAKVLCSYFKQCLLRHEWTLRLEYPQWANFF